MPVNKLADADSVLFIQTHGIGDVIMTMPMLRVLRRNLPKARISLIVKSDVEASLFEHTQIVDDIHTYQGSNRFIQVVKLYRSLRQKSFQLGVVAYGVDPHRATVLFKLLRIPITVGYRCGMKGQIGNFTFSLEDINEHKVIKNLQLAKSIGCSYDYDRVMGGLHISPREQLWGREWLKRSGISADLSIGLAPGSGIEESHKRWSPENYKKLIHLINHDLPKAKVLIFGGPEETDLAIDLANTFEDQVYSLIGKLSLRQTAVLISYCRAIIGGDNGLLHISGALSVPTVAVFGPTDYYVTGPSGAHVWPVSLSLPCSPCYPALLKGCGKPICMEQIQPRIVMAKLRSLLRERSPRTLIKAQ